MSENILVNKYIPDKLRSNPNVSKLLTTLFKSNETVKEISQHPEKIFSIEFLNDVIESNSSVSSVFKDFKEKMFLSFFNEFYTQISSLKDNKELEEFFRKIYSDLDIENYFTGLDFDLDSVISEESVISSKELKSLKGTLKGFYFIFDILNKIDIQKINASKNSNYLAVKENGDFSYKIETNYFKEIVKETLIPLNHPIGYIYDILVILNVILEDHYDYVESKTVTELSAECLKQDSTEITDLLHYKKDLKSFKIDEDVEKRTRTILDFYPENSSTEDSENGFRIIKDFDGTVYILNKQEGYEVKDSEFNGDYTGEKLYNEISNIYFDENLGEYTPVFENKTILGTSYKVLKGFYFKGYTIQEITSISFEFNELNSLDKKYKCSLDLSLTPSNDRKFYIPVFISREDIINASMENLDGRLRKTLQSCKIKEIIDIKFKRAVSDISDNILKIYPNSTERQEHSLEISDYSKRYDFFNSVVGSIPGLVRNFKIGEGFVNYQDKPPEEKYQSSEIYTLFENQTYEYSTFKNSFITGSTNDEIGEYLINGEYYKEIVDAEVYNFYNYDKDTLESSNKKEIKDDYPELDESLTEFVEYNYFDYFNSKNDNYFILRNTKIGEDQTIGYEKTEIEDSISNVLTFYSEKNLYEYNTYKDGFITGSTNSKIGDYYLRGSILSEEVNAEVYNFYNYDKDTLESSNKKEIKDDYPELEDLKITEIKYENNFDYFESQDDNYFTVGKSSLTDSSENLYVLSKQKKIQENKETLLNFSEDNEKNLYEYDTYIDGFVIGSTNDEIGKYYLKGRIFTEIVHSDVYNFENYDLDEYDKSLFDFGVYDSDGNRIQDNNVSAASWLIKLIKNLIKSFFKMFYI